MSRKGFWYGLIAGMVVMGMMVATIAVIVAAFRWSPGKAISTHGPALGFDPREGAKGFAFRGWGPGFGRHGRLVGFGALLCLHVPLLALGGLFVAAMVGKRACWHRRHFHHGYWGKHHVGRPGTGDVVHEHEEDQSSATD